MRKIVCDTWYMPCFKEGICFINKTHIHACVCDVDKDAYISHIGTPSQNILAICAFNLCFTFIFSSLEGFVHDSQLLKHIMQDKDSSLPFL